MTWIDTIAKNQNAVSVHYIKFYICSPMGVEHSGEGIYSCRLHNAKLFERIEHSGIQ